MSIVVIDKELDAICELADRHFVVEKGEGVWQGATPALLADGAVQERYLSV